MKHHLTVTTSGTGTGRILLNQQPLPGVRAVTLHTEVGNIDTATVTLVLTQGATYNGETLIDLSEENQQTLHKLGWTHTEPNTP